MTDKPSETRGVFTLTLPGDLFEPLDQAAKKLVLPKTAVIRMLVRHYLRPLVKKLGD